MGHDCGGTKAESEAPQNHYRAPNADLKTERLTITDYYLFRCTVIGF
jgi:hypothetical protein